MTRAIPIEHIEHLTKLALTGNGVHLFVRMNGRVRSSKFVSFNGRRFYIFNEIDGSEQRLAPQNLSAAGLLLEAIATGNCFAEVT